MSHRGYGPPYGPPVGLPVDPDLEAKKAAARAYALSSTTGGYSKNKKKKAAVKKQAKAAAAGAGRSTAASTSRSGRTDSEAEAAASLLGASRMPPRPPHTHTYTPPPRAQYQEWPAYGGGQGGYASAAHPQQPPQGAQQPQELTEPQQGSGSSSNFDLLVSTASNQPPQQPRQQPQQQPQRLPNTPPAKRPGYGHLGVGSSPGPIGLTIAAPTVGAELAAARASGGGAAGHGASAMDLNALEGDDEYLKFVRSLCMDPLLGPEDDLASLISRGGAAAAANGGDDDDDDDEDDGGSYQLTSDEEQDDDDDELMGLDGDQEEEEEVEDGEEDDGNNNSVNNESRNRKRGSSGSRGKSTASSAAASSSEKKANGTAAVGERGGPSLFAVVTGRARASSSSSSVSKSKRKRLSTSSSAAAATPSTPPAKSSNTTPRSLNLYSEGAKSPTFGNNNLNMMAELEAELSLLLEEDMDAAVSTLLGGHLGGAVPSNLGGGAGGGAGGAASAGSAIGGAKGSNSAEATAAAAKASAGASEPLSGSAAAAATAAKPTHGETASNNARFRPLPSTPKGTSKNGATASDSNVPPTPKAAKAQLPTSAQIIELRNLMSMHYQLLLQQSVLAVRSANHQRQQRSDCYGNDPIGESIASDVDAAAVLVSAKAGVTGSNNCDGDKKGTSRGDDPVLGPANFFFGGESADDLAEILDGAVGMLQDLDENRKDGIRNALQLEFTRRHRRQPKKKKKGNDVLSSPPAKSTSLGGLGGGDDSSGSNQSDTESNPGPRRLTRSAFQQTLKAREGGAVPQGQESNHSWSHTNDLPIATSFDVKGLSKLESSFASIDSSVDVAAAQRSYNAATAVALSRLTFPDYNVLTEEDNGDACEILLRRAGAHYDKKMIPGRPDLTESMTYPQEILGPKFSPPADGDLQAQIRRNRNQFTCGEDNLILRGVNLYGEKEWLMISDRFLPDRTVSSISQRYTRLCLLMYRAAGVKITAEGNLDLPSKQPKGAEDFDLAAISKITPVAPPARFNVHRWSLEEDIALLKAVPLMGYSWAEIGNRIIRHRDRGQLRKRYQVLERRVKASVKREKKMAKSYVKAKPKSAPPPYEARPRPTAAAAPNSNGPLTAAAGGTTTAASRSIVPPLPETEAKMGKATKVPPQTAVATATTGAFPYPPQYYYYPPIPAAGSGTSVIQQPGAKGGYPGFQYPFPYYYPPGYVPPEGYDHNGMKKKESKTGAGKASVSAKPPTTAVYGTSGAPPTKSTGPRHPGAPAGQANGGKGSARGKTSSPSKVLGADRPMVPPRDLHGQGDESTRLGFESILEDQDEWSQMSRVKQMIDEGESVRPRSMANQMERLPSKKKKTPYSEGSIMATVMERANSRSSSATSSTKSSHPGAGRGKKRKNSALERQHSLERAVQHLQGTPTKGPPSSSSQHSLAPLTPMTYTAGDLPPIAETPGEASIGSLLASLKTPNKASPPKSPSKTGGDATLMGMMRSPGGGMINLDGFDVSNFSTSGGDGLSRLATVTGLTSQGMFGTNSLMDDMEAIGALTALSNPPTPHVSAPNTPQKPIGGVPRRIDASNGDSGISLFAKAVGQLAEKKKAGSSPKKKSKKKR